MRVLIYFSGKLHEPKGTPIRTRNQITQLIGHGAEVFYAGHDVPDGIPSERVLMLARPFSRIGQMLSFIRMNTIDLVYIQTSAGLWYAPFITLFSKAKVGVDFHSRLFQEEHVYKNRSSLHTALMELIEMQLCHFLTFGTSVSRTISDYYGRAVPKMLTLPVGVDTNVFSPTVTPDAATIAWKGEATLIAYAGNTKWYQGVEGVLQSFERLSKKNPGAWKFLVIASSGIEDVTAYAKEHGLENSMRILDKQPHSAIPSLLAAADILTVVRPSDMVTEYSFPSKLPEYAALGKALVVSRISDIEDYVKDGESGLVVPPSDPEALYPALEKLEDQALRIRLGKAARLLAQERFNVTVLGKVLTEFLASVK